MSLFQPEFGLMFWMLVVFLIVLGILAKFAWPVIISSIEKRADFIDDGVRFTQEAIERRERAETEAQALLADTRRKQLDIMKESETIKQNMISEAKESAAIEAKKVLEVARLSAEQIKKDAESYIRDEVSVLSLQIAEKVLRKELTDKTAQEGMVRTYIDEMNKG
ncbi:F0F1 ATP synthase subunit B [Odoribacter sp. OttesenSCG-928-G04]|nr:F0F1 ATP synthase subunit B [Odoribacter sp. OttesenSCG-928-G04]